MELSKVIGIISYLPNDRENREWRQTRLNNLLDACQRFFPTLPIIIVAQNWPEDLYKGRANTFIHRYDRPLTIVGARRELRRLFLEQYNYDYLIMLDDDCELHCGAVDISKEDCTKTYLEQIDENPDCWIESCGSLLKLFAISREVFKGVDYDNVSLERREGYEDWVFYEKLKSLYPNKRRRFRNVQIFQSSTSTADQHSTWYENQSVDLRDLLEKTVYLARKYNKDFTIGPVPIPPKDEHE